MLHFEYFSLFQLKSKKQPNKQNKTNNNKCWWLYLFLTELPIVCFFLDLRSNGFITSKSKAIEHLQYHNHATCQWKIRIYQNFGLQLLSVTKIVWERTQFLLNFCESVNVKHVNISSEWLTMVKIPTGLLDL